MAEKKDDKEFQDPQSSLDANEGAVQDHETESELEERDEGPEVEIIEEEEDPRDTMIQNLREGNIKIKEELEEAKEELLRSRADYENLKRRGQRERFEEIKRAKKGVFLAFLQVLDNFERALQTRNKDRETFVQGIEMIHKQLIETFSQEHVYEIKAKGTPFNPHMHEAMVQLPTNDVPENTVVDVFQTGYSFNGELLRASQVSVSCPKPEEAPTESSPEEHAIEVKTDSPDNAG